MYLHVPEVWESEFHQPVFKKVTKAGLNSLRQKGYHVLVKNWVFDDLFLKKLPVPDGLIITIPFFY